MVTIDKAWAAERTRLISWEQELYTKEADLRIAVKAKDYAAKRKILAWFDYNGVDSLAGY